MDCFQCKGKINFAQRVNGLADVLTIKRANSFNVGNKIAAAAKHFIDQLTSNPCKEFGSLGLKQSLEESSFLCVVSFPSSEKRMSGNDFL